MSHFLSEATHQRLELRELPVEYVDPQTGDPINANAAGVVKTHSFESLMRCVCVVGADASILQQRARHPLTKKLALAYSEDVERVGKKASEALNLMPTLQVWSGDIDGSITVRLGLAGRPVYIAGKEEKIFPHSLYHHNGFVWVGLSTGQLRVYDTRTLKCVFEGHAHQGPVHAITAVNGVVITAGADWRILQWNPENFERFTQGQLSGHQNAVRCLAQGNTGNMLFSGGDDNVIRCWDVETGLEVGAPFPLMAHSAGIRAMLVQDVYLFSASTDGTVKVWNTETGALVRVLEDRGTNVAVNGLAFDAASGTVWTAGADGMIRLWDAATLTVVAELSEHHMASVAAVEAVGRATAFRVWTVGKDGDVRIFFSDPDCACNASGEGGYEALREGENALQGEIESRRATILRNYEELEELRDTHEQLRLKAQGYKERAAVALELRREHRRRHELYVAWRKWINKRHQKRVREASAALLGAQCKTMMVQRYFWALHRFRRERRENRDAKRMVKLIREAQEEELRQKYLTIVVKAADEKRKHESRLRAAEALVLNSQRAATLGTMMLWRKFAQLSKRRRDLGPVAQRLMLATRSGMSALYWTRLQRAVEKAKKAARVAHAAKAFCAMSDRNFAHGIFTRWMRAVSDRQRLHRCVAASVAYKMVVDNEMQQRTFLRWREAAADADAASALRHVVAMREKVREMKQHLADTEHITPESVATELHERQLRLAEKVAEVAELDRDIELEKRAQRELRRDMLKAESNIDVNASPREQLDATMHQIKGKAFHAGQHLQVAMDLREECRTRPALNFTEGVEQVREVLVKALTPSRLTFDGQPDWIIDDETLATLPRRKLATALDGILRMVVAYDCLKPTDIAAWQARPKKEGGARSWLPSATQAQEAVANGFIMLQMVQRGYANIQAARGSIESEVVAKRSRGRSASPRRSSSSKRNKAKAERSSSKKRSGSKSAKRSGSKSPKAKKGVRA